MARPLRRSWLLRRGLRRIAALPPGTGPSRDDLLMLREGWGNTMWSADVDYLEAVCGEALVTKQPILECGSGLTTILLAYLCGRRGIPVWSLEHDAGWHRRMSRFLERRRLPATGLVFAPLEDHGTYAWYDVSPSTFPPEFGLVICDGPPGDTPGGRYGLLPILGTRLGSGALILVDDAEREAESKMLDRWHEEFKIEIARRQGERGAYARVRWNG